MILLLHFHKAAGTSVVDAFRTSGFRFHDPHTNANPWTAGRRELIEFWDFDADRLNDWLDRIENQGVQVLACEWDFLRPEVFAECRNRFRLVTCIRDPLERVVSHYRIAGGDGAHGSIENWYARVRETWRRRRTEREFPITSNFPNYYVRMLNALGREADAHIGVEHLDRACKTLERFDVVTILGRPASLELLRRVGIRGGLPHRNQGRKPHPEISEEFVESFWRRNALDRVLFERANEISRGLAESPEPVRRVFAVPRSPYPSTREAEWSRGLKGLELLWPSLAPKFAICPPGRVFTVGDWSARELEKGLPKKGFVLPMTSFELPSKERKPGPHGALACHTPRDWLRLLEWALEAEKAGVTEQNTSAWALDSEEGLLDRGVASKPVGRERFLERRGEILAVVQRVFDSDLIVLAFNSVEVERWDAHQSDPGPRTRIPSRDELKSQIERSLEIVRDRNPRALFVLVTSPVVLERTGTGLDVLVAEARGKALLTSVAAEIAATSPDVDTMPFHEVLAASRSGRHWRGPASPIPSAGVGNDWAERFARVFWSGDSIAGSLPRQYGPAMDSTGRLPALRRNTLEAQVLGPFNSGTNLMFVYHRELFAIPIRFHTFFWKHSLPPDFKPAEKSRLTPELDVPIGRLMKAARFVCMVRSPYFWIHSTLKHPYTLRFLDRRSTRLDSLRSRIEFHGDVFASLSVLWNAYYRAYLEELPALRTRFVRLEDLVAYPSSTLATVGEGLERKKGVDEAATIDSIHQRPAKRHGGEACVFGDDARALYVPERVGEFFDAEEIAAINAGLDRGLMKRFGYPVIEP